MTILTIDDEENNQVEEEPGIYGRMIGRTVKQFAVIFMILIVMNLFLMWLTGSLGSISSLLHSRRSWFNIVVLCTWPFPIGETIWFIQSLLYARIILFIMDRIGLMRHYKIVLIVTALLGTIIFREMPSPAHSPTCCSEDCFTRSVTRSSNAPSGSIVQVSSLGYLQRSERCFCWQRQVS